jgi:hypothetical protein
MKQSMVLYFCGLAFLARFYGLASLARLCGLAFLVRFFGLASLMCVIYETILKNR